MQLERGQRTRQGAYVADRRAGPGHRPAGQHRAVPLCRVRPAGEGAPVFLLRPGHQQPGRLFGREGARDVGGGDQAAVPSGDRVGAQPPALPEPEQGDLVAEEGTPGVRGFAEQPGVGAVLRGEDHRDQGHRQAGVEAAAERVEGGPVGGEGAVQGPGQGG
nr:hypothetical protein [Streptomyces sp. WA1-19]WGN98067.1 Agt17 [Streptomyces argenteolus]